MQNKVRNTVEKGNRKWLVATVEMKRGETWDLSSEGPEHADGSEFTDTSHHVGVYLSGRFNTQHPGRSPLVIRGPSEGSGYAHTGKRSKYPRGEFTVRCTGKGTILFILPRGAEVPLDHVLLEPGETAEVSSGWSVDLGGSYAVDEVSGTVEAAELMLVFWEK